MRQYLRFTLFWLGLLHGTGTMAAALDLAAADAGFITAEGGSSKFDSLIPPDTTAATYNYSVGWEAHYDGGGIKPTVPLKFMEKKNYFVFDLSAISGTVTSAVLELPFPSGGYDSADATETFVLSATPLTAAELAGLKTAPTVPAPSFPFFDIDPGVIGGTAALFAALTAKYDDFGEVLGTTTRAATDLTDPLAITLTAAGLAYLNGHAGGEVVLGGRLTSLSHVDGHTEELFGGTAPWLDPSSPTFVPTGPPTLSLEISAVPLPGALPLLGSSLLGLGMLGRRRRRRTGVLSGERC